MVSEIEARPFYRSVDHGQALYPLFAKHTVEHCLGGDMAATEGTMQASEQTDQQWFLAAIVESCWS
jgi:hypothetical protein